MAPEHLLEATIAPPVARRQPQPLTVHGDERIDDYYWMRNKDDPEAIAHLKAENEYTKAATRHTETLQETLYQEMLARIQETDLSVPYRKGAYYYYSRTEEGKDYPIYCRKHGSLDAPEEILLDQNQLAIGRDYCSLGVFEVSPDHNILAYSIDTTGAEQHTLYFLDLNTRRRYPEAIPDTYYSLAWGNDNRTVFYTKVDETNRPYQLYRHELGTPVVADVLVYEEADESFFLYASKTRSQAYLLAVSHSKITSEVRYLDANQPLADWRVVHPRERGMEYSIEHHGEHFYIVTNDSAIDFKLVRSPVDTPGKAFWETVIPHRDDVLLTGVSAFADRLVIYERRTGLPAVRIRQLSTGEEHDIDFPEPTYAVYEGNNPEFHTQTLRFNYTSPITPYSVFDYHMDTRQRELKKETPVLGGYDRAHYVCDRIMAVAADGARVPISIAYKKGIRRDGSNPLLLCGYGSYGFSYPPSFSSNRLSLLNRGVIFAIAHIRGGSEMGRQWYENGKFLHKKNTFTDFIACAEHLIAEGWTSSDRLAISGGSAGGLLIGAVLNLRPDLFKVAIAQVPFVDVVTTMLDADLPLTVTEWEEWGNPKDPVYYEYMKSYSPYDNVRATAYPHLLVTAGLNDPRVQYWEPAKWTAKLRRWKTDRNLLLLKTNMEAGHAGASGRYQSLKETAFEYAFLLDRLGVARQD